MTQKIYAQLVMTIILPTHDSEVAKKKASIKSASQQKKLKSKLSQLGIEVTSTGPSIGISMEVKDFEKTFQTKVEVSHDHTMYASAPLIIPASLKGFVSEVAISSLPEFF